MRIFDSLHGSGNNQRSQQQHHSTSIPNLVIRQPANGHAATSYNSYNNGNATTRQMAFNNQQQRQQQQQNNINSLHHNNSKQQLANHHEPQPTKWPTRLAQLEVCRAEFWRSTLAECLSSCIYVFIVCSTRISWTGSIIGHEPNLVAVALASGITMKLLIYSFRSVHVNPALTISLFLLMRISLLRTILYIFAQCLGAIAASAFLYLVSVKGHGGALGVDNPHEQLLLWHVLVVELVISFLVTLVTYATFSWSTYKTFISNNAANCTAKINANTDNHRHIRNNTKSHTNHLQTPFLISNHYNRVCDDATSNIISDIRTNKSQMAFNNNLTVSNRNNNHHLPTQAPLHQQQQHQNSNQLIFNNQEQVENFIATIQQQTNNNINNQPDSGYSNSSSSNGNNNNNNRSSANNNSRYEYPPELSYNPTTANNNNNNKQQQQHYLDEQYIEAIQQQQNHRAQSDDHHDDEYDNHRLYAAAQFRGPSLNQPAGVDSTFNQALAPNGFPVHFTGNQALVIGLAYIVATLTGIPASGASLNPARSLGPAFIMNRWINHWVYWLGPIAGAILAAFVYEFVFNPLRKNSPCFRPSILKQTNCQDDDDDDSNNIPSIKQTIKYQRSPLVKSSSSFRSIQSNTPALVKSTLNLPTQFSQHLQHQLSTTITGINPTQPDMIDKSLEPQFHHHLNFQNQGALMINDDQNVNYDRVIYADPNSDVEQQLVDAPRPHTNNRNLMGYRPKSSQHIDNSQMNANQIMPMSTTLGFRAQQRLINQFDLTKLNIETNSRSNN